MHVAWQSCTLLPALCSQVEGWESHALKPPLWFTRSSCPDMSMCFIVLTIVCTIHCYCGLPLDTCGQWTVHVMHACLWSTLSTVSGYGIGLRWSGIMAIRSTLTKGHSTTQRHLWEHHHLNKYRKNSKNCQSQVTWKAKFKCQFVPPRVPSRPVLSHHHDHHVHHNHRDQHDHHDHHDCEDHDNMRKMKVIWGSWRLSDLI